MINGESPEMTLELARATAQAIIHSPYMYVFLSLVFLDFVTGMSKAFLQGIYESKVGINGIVRHALVFLLIIFFKFFGRIFGVQSIGTALTVLFSINYFVSILENVEGAGVKFPEVIKEKFIQMQRNAERQIAQKLEVNIEVKEENKKQ